MYCINLSTVLIIFHCAFFLSFYLFLSFFFTVFFFYNWRTFCFCTICMGFLCITLHCNDWFVYLHLAIFHLYWFISPGLFSNQFTVIIAYITWSFLFITRHSIFLDFLCWLSDSFLCTLYSSPHFGNILFMDVSVTCFIFLFIYAQWLLITTFSWIFFCWLSDFSFACCILLHTLAIFVMDCYLYSSKRILGFTLWLSDSFCMFNILYMLLYFYYYMIMNVCVMLSIFSFVWDIFLNYIF